MSELLFHKVRPLDFVSGHSVIVDANVVNEAVPLISNIRFGLADREVTKRVDLLVLDSTPRGREFSASAKELVIAVLEGFP